VRFLGIPASGIVTTAYRTQTEFTATSGQTTFSVPSYTVGFIDVYRNGALLGSADFTATNGTTVVLAAGASAGDLVETISFSISSVLNAIPATAGAVNSTYLLDGSVTQAKLAAGVAGNGPAFSVYLNGNQSVSGSTYTKVAFDTEVFDTNSNFASNRFTPTVAGYYQINSGIIFASTVTYAQINIYKNGNQYQTSWSQEASSNYGRVISSLVYCNGTTDYIEIYGYVAATTPRFNGGSENTWFNGVLVRAA
jgi:hypothetical protein